MNGGTSRADCIRSGSLAPMVRGKNDPAPGGLWVWRAIDALRGRWVQSSTWIPPDDKHPARWQDSDGSWFVPSEHPFGQGDPDHEDKMARIREAIESNRRKGIV